MILDFCERVKREGGRALLVGGYVRDRLRGEESGEYDLEVYGIEPPKLRAMLDELGDVDAVGESFTVYKVRFRARERGGDSSAPPVDVSLPRRESKTARGHRGFVIEGDPHLSFVEACRRRDFTINAILLDPLSEERIDPFHGERDIEQRVLRAVDEKTFSEDSLRVLRLLQFAARFEYGVDEATKELCKTINLSDLPAERIWGEMEKLLLRARRPSIGLSLARELGVIKQLFPELETLAGCPQEPEWHPEGDVWTHTLLAIDKAAEISAGLPRECRVAVMLGVLCHDFGKPLTTTVIDGRIRSFDHEAQGIAPATRFLDRLGVHSMNGLDVRHQALAIVGNHLKPSQFYKERERVTTGAFRRLATKCDLELLYFGAKADSLGRTEKYPHAEAEEWFLERARELGVCHRAPEPLLLGRHLLTLGMQPGPEIGRVLKEVYELQLDGKVATLEEAIDAARNLKD